MSLLLGAAVGLMLAHLLISLLGVIFTIPATQLLALSVLVAFGMIASVLVSSRRLTTMRVVDVLRKL